ncbi:GNAT family N-acetyltransferase [Rudaeicoccus suwonensis]|uniref:L-amino acid N-acyltransferase YncA n=1 Tax=Rudaeicoccus suwonensis TaxID=657409 RepID=A0A561EBB5_9MICO|nr:GNAT family N-acetyltransferase [Rudaeicoccus suwonensis]TWE12899.1 L-amino acid N-acyltransferase YncA [Rudaeicoccus suwonensis]
MTTTTAGIDVRLADAEDAFAVAALILRWDLAEGAPMRPGFIDEFADAWLADRASRPTWLAVQANGDPVGVVIASLVRKLPSLRRPATAWLHLASVYVAPELRGQGIGARLLESVVDWCPQHGVTRLQLNSADAATEFYRRAGFGAPAARFMQLHLASER